MKILICDDQAVVREGLELLLQLERDITVVATAGDGAEALELVALHQPDLVLMDLKMPGMNGIEATRQICARYPGMKVLVLTTYDDDEWLFDALRAGAHGYLLKDTRREDIVRAIRGTLAGQTFLDPNVAGRVLEQATRPHAPPATLLTKTLTERELDVLHWLARGLSNADIAERLALSEGTVRNYVSSILSKLGVSDRVQAALIALQHRL